LQCSLARVFQRGRVRLTSARGEESSHPSSRTLEVHRLHELARKVVIVLTMNFYHVQSMEVLQPTTHDHVNGLIFLFISS
jgi:hypothetical protein